MLLFLHFFLPFMISFLFFISLISNLSFNYVMILIFELSIHISSILNLLKSKTMLLKNA